MSAKKHILITESDCEIGRSVAAKFAAEGWEVSGLVLPGNNSGGKYVECDLMVRAEAVKAVAELEKAKGPLQALFVCPGFSLESVTEVPFLGSGLADWKNKLNAWLRLPANICWAAGLVMKARKYGRIIVVTPDFRNIKGDCIMEAAAAGALHGFIKSFGVEVACANVNVNGIFPSLPLDQEALNELCVYLVEEAGFVSAQLISIQAKK